MKIAYKFLIGKESILFGAKHENVALPNLSLNFEVRSVPASQDQPTIHNVLHVRCPRRLYMSQYIDRLTSVPGVEMCWLKSADATNYSQRATLKLGTKIIFMNAELHGSLLIRFITL